MRARSACLACALGLVSSFAQAQQSAEQVYRTVSPSVVVLRNIEGVGTGFVLQADGLILTNAHNLVSPLPLQAHIEVEEGGRTKTVVFKKVRVVGVHPKYDLALLRVDLAEHNVKLKPVTLSREKGRPGQAVVAIGNPAVGEGEILQKTITAGMMSAVDRVVEGLPYYQFSAQVNPGNSGGPLCDYAGNVLGIVTFKASNLEGIGFAIPLYQFNTDIFGPFRSRPEDRQEAAEMVKVADLYAQRAQEALKRFGKDDPRSYMLNSWALMLYRMALMAVRGNPEVYRKIGALYLVLGVHEAAAAYVLRAIEFEPWAADNGRQYQLLAMALVGQKRAAEAIVVLKEGAAKYAKEGAAVWQALALTSMSEKNYAEAAFAAAVAQRVKSADVDEQKLTQLHADALRKLRPPAQADVQKREANLWQEITALEDRAKQARAAKKKFVNDDFGAFMDKFEALREEPTEVVENPWGTSPRPQPEPTTPAPVDDETAKWIKSKLAMARLCMQHNLKPKAKETLEEILAKHPDRPETAEARSLLEELKKQP